MSRRVVFKGGAFDGKRRTIPDVAPVISGFPKWQGPPLADPSTQTYMNSGIINDQGEEVWIPISPLMPPQSEETKPSP